jgi:hypothetical protein
MELPDAAQQKALIEASGKLTFLKLLLPKLQARGHRVLLFSQVSVCVPTLILLKLFATISELTAVQNRPGPK